MSGRETCPRCGRHGPLTSGHPTYPPVCRRCAGRYLERSWVILGVRRGRLWLGRRVRERTGTPDRVDFDAAWVIDRHRRRRDVLGWCHTHPGAPAYVSMQDLTTARAWVGCLGRPLLCLVEGNRGLRGWVFDDDESTGRPLQFSQLVGKVIVGVERGRPAAVGAKLPLEASQ